MMFFPGLWILDVTCMSLYWVVRPLNKNLEEWGMETGPLTTPPAAPMLELDNSTQKRGIIRSDRRLVAKLNTKPLALSVSAAGALLVPLWTGSLMRFMAEPIMPAGVFYGADIDCAVETEIHARNRPACDEAARLARDPLRKKTTLLQFRLGRSAAKAHHVLGAPFHSNL
jgi:hypothetical protein